MRRTWGVLLLSGAIVFLIAGPARAHALVRSSDPPNGAVLQKAPSLVVITFTETPDPKLSTIHVLDSGGKDVERGTATPVPGQPLELRVALGSLPQGVYTVTWRTVSRVDGHVTGGSFSFGVGVSPPTVPVTNAGTPSTPSPSAAAVAGRWAFYWGLAILVGGAAFGLIVSRGLPRPGRFVLAGGWGLAVVGLVLMTAAERSAVGIPLGQLLRSGTGREFIRRAVALGVAGVAVAAEMARPRRAALAFVGLAAAAAMFVHVMAGHAGAGTRTPYRWFDIAVQGLHVVAVGIWIGGLVWLLLAARALDGAERVAVVRRFSWLAGIALGAVALTGLIRAIAELGGVHALRGLLHTSFGIALMVKVVLFGGLVALGAFNRYVNVPGITEGTRPIGSLRRTMAAEVLIAAGILGTTGILSSLPPASSIAAAASAKRSAAQELVVKGSDFATTTRVRLTVSPGTVGPNRFEARITDYDTGRPVHATQVTLRFSLHGRPDLGTPTLPLTQTTSGLWIGQGTVLSMDGRWDVSVAIQEANGGVEVPLQLETRLPPEEIRVSRASGQPDLYTISLAAGRSLQSYVDPGKAGRNTVHFTFFQASGNEQPISSATATALTPSGDTVSLPLIRFDAGHFASNTDLVPGSWRFQIRATMPNGEVQSAYFSQQIPS